MSLKRSQLISVAKELNEQLGLEPAIDTKPGKKNTYLEGMIKEASELINPKEDEFTDETWDVLKQLGVKTEKDEEEAPEPESDEDAEKPEEVIAEKQEEQEPEPVKTEKKVGKKTSGKKKDAFKGPGVIKTIVSLVEKAGKKGITKEEILEELQDAFPDRDPKAMRKTINVQVPNRINKERFPVGKKDGGLYFKEDK